MRIFKYFFCKIPITEYKNADISITVYPDALCVDDSVINWICIDDIHFRRRGGTAEILKTATLWRIRSSRNGYTVGRTDRRQPYGTKTES